MIHYHGTPITPLDQLRRMAGRNFCISFNRTENLKTCLEIGQALMFDNGAFSAYTGKARRRNLGTPEYLRWLDPILRPPHWAVIPDVIDGDVAEQRRALQRWPHRADLSAPVWHLALPVDYLLELADRWPRVCFGSSGEYWKVGSATWARRMEEACNALAKRHRVLPWLHGLRMLGQVGERWPLASADSTNVGRNFKRDTGCAECKAAPIDARQMRAP